MAKTRYCPVCDDYMIYDPATDDWYCIECELVISLNKPNTGLDKACALCYPVVRPRLRRTPVRLSNSVIQG